MDPVTCCISEIKSKGGFFRYIFFLCTFLNSASSATPQIPLCPKDAVIAPRTVATLALTARRPTNSARSHPPPPRSNGRSELLYPFSSPISYKWQASIHATQGEERVGENYGSRTFLLRSELIREGLAEASDKRDHALGFHSL
jgi:hypothetical protein